MRRTIVATLIGGAAFLLSFSAAANGRFPLSNQIVFSTTDSNLIVTRTSYGILVSHDNGGSWSLICEDAIGITPSTLADPPVGLTQNDSLLVGVQQGLNVSSDVGCNWNCAGGAGLAGNPIADLAVRPDNPSSAVAMTLSYPETDSGLVLTNSQVFETTNNGVAWVPLGDAGLDPTIVVTTVEVAKTDPQRLYVSATRGFGLTQTASLFVSKDKGQTWTEYPLPKNQFDPTLEIGIYIGAVDPTNANRLYLRSRGQPTGGESRLTAVTLSADGGPPTFTTVRIFDVEAGFSGLQGEMLGLALSPDGSKIYIGTKEDGVVDGADVQPQFSEAIFGHRPVSGDARLRALGLLGRRVRVHRRRVDRQREDVHVEATAHRRPRGSGRVQGERDRRRVRSGRQLVAVSGAVRAVLLDLRVWAADHRRIARGR